MSATSITIVIRGEVYTGVHVPRESWPGYVAVEVTDEDFTGAASIFITEAKARTLVEQLTAALARMPVEAAS